MSTIGVHWRRVPRSHDFLAKDDHVGRNGDRSWGRRRHRSGQGDSGSRGNAWSDPAISFERRPVHHGRSLGTRPIHIWIHCHCHNLPFIDPSIKNERK
jgi:hypothetical protein